MMHALSSDEVMKHTLRSYAFEQLEQRRYEARVTAAQQAGEREVASTCPTILRKEQAMAAWIWGAAAAAHKAVSAAIGDGS